jgi:phage protein D
MDNPSSYVSAPQILLSGQKDSDLSDNVVSILVEESIDGLFRCEIVLNNFGMIPNVGMDYLFFDRSKLNFGKEIGLRLGPGTPPVQLFSGRITALEAEYPAGGGSRIVVLAEDRLQDLRMTRRTRNFEDVSDADIIQQIAGEHGLEADVNATGPQHKCITQVNQSDLAFVRERARAVNAEVWVNEKKLQIKPRTSQTGSPVELAYGAGLFAFQVRADLAHQCTELSVSGWDVANKDTIQETADSSAVSGELGFGQDGGSILKTALGERKASVVHTVPLTSTEAQSIAKARYRERARRFVTGSAEAEGNPKIRVGTTVQLAELGDMFNGKYYVTRTVHLFDVASGYRTEFDVESPRIGR